jgi:hypothetical protein
MSTYDVGQVVFVVSSAKMAVYPLVIAEEVTRKTLAGEEKTYLVKKNQRDDSFDLSRVAGEIYTDINDVKSALIDNVTRAISKICDNAKKRSSDLAPPRSSTKEKPGPRKKSQVEQPTDDQIKSFVLENGTKARVNLEDI